MGLIWIKLLRLWKHLTVYWKIYSGDNYTWISDRCVRQFNCSWIHYL